ncbi:sigma-70 family RNA polymerase sigma factor [Synechococcus sp. AH-601-P18]|nr:sigma-70 family RNA polymerase sigma factor [Synechococcus sp. AH-601-P18]
MVSDWLKGASRFPLLTADQEIDLAHKVQRGMAEEATPAEKRIGARAKNKMVQSNLKLVVNVSKKFIPVTRHSNALDLADLFQEGVVGLNRAVEKFDPCAGYKLSTYAYWWIRQSISRAIETQKTTIRVPTQVAQLANRARKAPEHITTRAELQEWLGATDNQMEMVERAQSIGRMSSLDKLAKEDGATLLELIPDEQNQPTLDEFDWQLARESIAAAFEGEPLIEEFARFVCEKVSYKSQADAMGLHRNTLSKQVHSLISRKKDELSHLRKFIEA